MGMQMSLKFEKYWSECNQILAIATILDPRYKLQFIEWAYAKLHGKDSLELHGVHETLFSLFNVYMEALSPILNLSHSKQETFGPTSSEDAIFEDFDICYKEASVSIKTEIHKYFDDERLDRKKELDVLTWWKGQQMHYPILSHLARDVLTIPISTVASESAFSIRGRVLDQYRSSLSPDTVQALVCTRD
ncbi:hypothetical protein Q3G72_028543 [Acer saccharum]|nr:hypothetical protein Q3G72_028543 [Acer saccharum]